MKDAIAYLSEISIAVLAFFAGVTLILPAYLIGTAECAKNASTGFLGLLLGRLADGYTTLIFIIGILIAIFGMFLALGMIPISLYRQIRNVMPQTSNPHTTHKIGDTK